MKLDKKFSGLTIFLVGLASSIALTIPANPLYDKFFQVYSGGWILDFGTYPGTFSLVYVFLTALLYTAFSKHYKGLNLFYFVLIPFLIFSVSGTDVFVAGALVLVAGLLLGKLIRKKII